MIKFLSPNTTSHLQPLDAEIIKLFKFHYHNLHIHWLLQQYENDTMDIPPTLLDTVYNIASAWDTVTTTTISNCWNKTGIMNTNDMTAATHFVEANIQDEELQLNSALNVLEPLVNYEILNLQEYIDVPAENEAIHRMLSIEEIVNTISQPDDTDNSDNDGPEFPKISISLALSSIHNISLFLQQEDPSLSTQNQLTILRKLTRKLNSMFIERKTQKTLDDYVKPI